VSRRHRVNGRKALPYRLWLVVERGAQSDESSPHLVVARCPSQAARVWREATGYTADDFGVEDLDITPARWEWPSVPEPRWPRKPCTWSPAGKAPDGDELFRGYGLRLEGDVRCVVCDELTAEDRIVRVTDAYGDTEPLCPQCLREAQAEQVAS
jgi:hypothetical protein